MAEVNITSLNSHYPFRNLCAKYGGGSEIGEVWIKVCNVNSQENSKRVCILTMSIFLIGGLNVRQNGRLFE
jgi:hypothetical protein